MFQCAVIRSCIIAVDNFQHLVLAKLSIRIFTEGVQ